MIAGGIRLLFVINQYEQVTGIITSRDLDGDRVMRRLAEAGGRRQDLTVREIMTPQHKIEILDMQDVKYRLGKTLRHLHGVPPNPVTVNGTVVGKIEHLLPV